ncbi:MAG: hypothetical protein ACE5JI_18165 [Acidobacteriota bacterium]
MTPNSVFEGFLRDIEPSRTTKSNASSAHSALREFLPTHETFSNVLVDSFLSGSYRRDTAIRPRLRDGGLERGMSPSQLKAEWQLLTLVL